MSPGVALVTGACSGIGRALAEGLAARGHDLVLVSERPGPLEQAAAELRAQHRIRAHVLAQDLARPEAATAVSEELSRRSIAIDTLVNNAGMLFFGEAVDADPRRAAALLQLHVVTPSLLCTHLGHAMRRRGRGRILIVSSISAVRDLPGISYYGASKKYLRGFARALRTELAPHGVQVTCLLPGPTATGLYAQTGAPVELARRLGVMMTPAAVAEAGLRALERGDAECIPGLLTRALGRLTELAPQALVEGARRSPPAVALLRRAARVSDKL